MVVRMGRGFAGFHRINRIGDNENLAPSNEDLS
jgi:hypothetical protein